VLGIILGTSKSALSIFGLSALFSFLEFSPMNWKHSLYQIYAITFGQSFTIDEAYRLLTELREDRDFAIASAFAETRRAQAKVIDAKTTELAFSKGNELKANSRRAEASLLETRARFIIAQPCLDMARVEREYIQSLIDYIEQNKLLIFDNPVYGAQAVQPLEYAFEHVWALTFDGSSSDLMRNIYANPYADAILKVGTQREADKMPTRISLCNALAAELNLPIEKLSVSVNVLQDVQYPRTLIEGYGASHVKSITNLREVADAKLSGDNSASSRIEGPN
jgi:hypothetical protein